MRWLTLAAIAALAVVLAGQRVVLAQQPTEIVSVLRSGPLPVTDPFDPAWDEAPAADIPLGPQAMTIPSLLKLSVPTVRVRSLNNGDQIAFLLEWADDTRDDLTIADQQFRDAAAIQFPVGQELPNICMGAAGQLVNIWHWKADWQRDIDQGFQELVNEYPNFFKDFYPGGVTGTPPYTYPTDFDRPEARQFQVGWAVGNPFSVPQRPSPVEDLKAVGFGSLTHRDRQEVGGRGVWRDGRWRVVFTRKLAAPDGEAADLRRDQVPVAFAIWNGTNQEVGARKQLSGFYTLRIQGQERILGLPRNLIGWLVAGFVGVLAVTVVTLRFLRRRAATGRR
jgi:hypothetical protein